MNRTKRRRTLRRSTRIESPRHPDGTYRGNQAEYTEGYLWMMAWLAQRVDTEIVGDALREYVGRHMIAISNDCKWALSSHNRSRDFRQGVIGFMETVGRSRKSAGGDL